MPSPYTFLDFPLNVYAHCLYLQAGKVDYLHYALFNQQEPLTKVQVAQQRSTDLLLSRLPKPPCRILEIGMGLGTTASTLAERGYIVTGISPDAQQVAFAKQRVKKNVTLECVTYETFSAPAGSYDVILLQESAQYLQPLTLFNKAHHLLAKSGLILIADEFSLRRTPKYTTYGLPSLTHTLAKASRCGFNLTEQVDLSTQAAPTIDYLLWVIEKYQATLLTDLDLKQEIIDEMLSVLCEYQQKYYDGHYGYVLLNFVKTSLPRWQITPVTAQDKETVRALFNKVFQPGQMSDVHWEWKYGQDRGLGIAAWRDGKMIAYYGGIIRKIHYFGQSKLAAQIVDVMVLRKERSVFTQRGAFFLTAASFLECYMGYGAKTWLGYGFPTQQAMKIAQRLGLYAQVGKLIELRWQTTPGKPYLWTRIRHLQPEYPKKNQLIINKLWKKMALCLPNAIVGVRDFSYVQHRYCSHSHRHYELLLVTRRFSGSILGIAVIQREEEICRIMDFIGDLKYISEVLKQVRRMAGVWGMKQVIVWITENFLTIFPKSEAELYDLQIPIPHNIWSQGVPTDEVYGYWWLMAGDTDFL